MCDRALGGSFIGADDLTLLVNVVKVQRVAPLLAVVLTLFGITACGGGGSSGATPTGVSQAVTANGASGGANDTSGGANGASGGANGANGVGSAGTTSAASPIPLSPSASSVEIGGVAGTTVVAQQSGTPWPLGEDIAVLFPVPISPAS